MTTTDDTLDGSIEALKDELGGRIDQLERTVERQQSEIDQLQEENDELRAENAELTETVGKLVEDVFGDADAYADGEIERSPVHDRIDTLGDNVNSLRADFHEFTEESNTGANGAETDGSVTMHDLLPIDRIALEDEVEDCTMGNVTASVERAAAIYEHFREWSSKTTAGRIIRTSTDGRGASLKSLVATATGEDLSWKQITRACEKLEEWSQGVIEYKKTNRQGWVLVAPDDITVGYGQSSSVENQPGASVTTA